MRLDFYGEIQAHFYTTNELKMKQIDIPENGALVRFVRIDEEEWREGEFDAENKLYIEIYALELTTHQVEDIREWAYLHEV